LMSGRQDSNLSRPFRRDDDLPMTRPKKSLHFLFLMLTQIYT